MKEDRSVLLVSKVTIFLLILTNVQSDTGQQYQQSHQSYLDHGSLNNQSSMSLNNDAVAPRINWNWLFGQKNANKITQHPSRNPNENENDMLPNDKFIFPDIGVDSGNEHETLKLKIGEAPACKGKTFCENVPNYPTKLLDEVIKSRNLGFYESVDAMDITYRTNTPPTTLCSFKEQVVYPKTAENMNHKWLYVVNHPNFTQGVRIETCMTEGKMCNLINGFAIGYATNCEQKYIFRQLAAIDLNGSISREHFRFPSTCCCHVELVNSSLRFKVKSSVDSQMTKDNVDTD